MNIPVNSRLPGAAYSFYTFTEVATAATTTIQFGFRNDPSWLALDDVSVVADVVRNPRALIPGPFRNRSPDRGRLRECRRRCAKA